MSFLLFLWQVVHDPIRVTGKETDHSFNGLPVQYILLHGIEITIQIKSVSQRQCAFQIF